jgi:hypothetical protein
MKVIISPKSSWGYWKTFISLIDKSPPPRAVPLDEAEHRVLWEANLKRQ